MHTTLPSLWNDRPDDWDDAPPDTPGPPPRHEPPRPRRSRAVAVALAIAALAATGGGAYAIGSGGDSQPAAEVIAPTPKTDVGRVYAKVAAGVVSVRVGSGSGTGFLIDTKGTIVTNDHVVGEATTAKVRFGDDDALVDARVLGTDPSLGPRRTARRPRRRRRAEATGLRVLRRRRGRRHRDRGRLQRLGQRRHRLRRPVGHGAGDPPEDRRGRGDQAPVVRHLLTGDGERQRRPHPRGHRRSPAANVGMRAGDVITAIDGKTITGPDAVADAIADRAPGDRVNVVLTRSGQERTLQLTLGTRPETAP